MPPRSSSSSSARGKRFEEQVDALGRAVFPDRSLWIAWPKRSSGVATDMTEDVVREVALPLGLVDNKVCAIDATWSGLRLVWRKELRDLAPSRGMQVARQRLGNEKGATAEAPFPAGSPERKHVSLDLRVRRTVAFRRGSYILHRGGVADTHPSRVDRSPEWG